MYKIKYIISFIIIVFITLCLLYLHSSYVENRLINEILKEWHYKTDGGFIKLADNGRYKGDYYLSINDFDNKQNHIHFVPNCIKSDLCYIIRNHKLHSQLYFIDTNKPAGETANEMLQNYNKFQG